MTIWTPSLIFSNFEYQGRRGGEIIERESKFLHSRRVKRRGKG